jgi:N-sulfoglucosamine sulfohydrolase
MRLTRIVLLGFVALALNAVAADKPNIVWLFGEDMGPELGCYGDTNAITPVMDKAAAEGLRYLNCYTHAPVCAPSRSGLITGMYPTTIGTHHMRSRLFNPPAMFTKYLHDAGYTVCWPTKSQFGKTDFNFEVPSGSFDVVTDWTEKKPKEPFFGFYNIVWSHESKIRADAETYARLTSKLTPAERHDPKKMVLPPFYPDAPEVRHDLAQYYDLVTAVDKQMGEVLKKLDEWGIASNTIVLITGDHGRGMPRYKRWVYDTGIHVPLIIRWPGHVKPSSTTDDLVSFIDFGPTMLSVAGASLPTNMQGNIFLGANVQPRQYVFAARDRMDETPDRIRAVRDKRYQYIRNFHPELPYSQRIAYNEENPTMQVWRKWHVEGKLNPTQEAFFAPTKPKEEFYDCQTDPYEIHNLLESKSLSQEQQNKVNELRSAMDKWLADTKDMGAIPETELVKRGLVEDRISSYDERKVTGKVKPKKKNKRKRQAQAP